MALHESAEMYLESIYTLSQSNNFVRSIADKYVSAINAAADAATADSIRFYNMIIPTSIDITLNDVSRGKLNSSDQKDAIKYMYGAMNKNVKSVQIYDLLKAHKDEYLYYRTDHHWTSDGAYYAYEKICEELGMTPVERTLRKEYADFYGTLYSNAGARMVEADTVATFMLPQLEVTDENGQKREVYDESFADKKDKYSVFFGGNPPLVVLDNTEIEDGEKLLLIKDSYSNSLAPYLTHNFDEVHMWDLRANKTSLSQYIAENGITQVLVLYSTENFASDTNIMFMSK